MKLQFERQNRPGILGNVLVATLILTAVLGISLASYTKLVTSQNESVMHSLSWNSAIPVLEAGFEDALTHLWVNMTNNWDRDGWTQVNGVRMGSSNLTGTFYYKERRINNSNGFYRVAISDVRPPVVYSEGYVRLPMRTNEVSRVVRLTTRRDAMFAKGMVAKGSIDMNGQNVMTDSYDSADTSRSTNGMYSAALAGDQGDVASNAGIIGILSVGNANIYGRASTGPGGTVTVGANGGVGAHVWQASNHGIQPGWSSDDMNVQFPDVSDPFTSGYTTPGGNPYVIQSSGKFLLTDLTRPLIVRSNSIALLKITSSINITGNDYIRIERGSTLNLYMAGASASIGGNGVLNESGNATNFFYYGMPANTSLSLSGNSAFVGAIYAPNAAFTLSGGGNNTFDFCGASVTSTVRMNGHFNFHYDENLGRIGPSRGYVVTSWNEF